MAITVSGTTITFNDATTQTRGFTNPIPVANGGTGATDAPTARSNLGAGTGNGNGNGNGNGTVTSVATGNGLSGGTITSTGTLVVACPSFNTVGSYTFGSNNGQISGFSSGTNYSAGSGSNQMQSFSFLNGTDIQVTNNLSGTWKWMSGTTANSNGSLGLICRVS
jgi:hypothetical protein